MQKYFPQLYNLLQHFFNLIQQQQNTDTQMTMKQIDNITQQQKVLNDIDNNDSEAICSDDENNIDDESSIHLTTLIEPVATNEINTTRSILLNKNHQQVQCTKLIQSKQASSSRSIKSSKIRECETTIIKDQNCTNSVMSVEQICTTVKTKNIDLITLQLQNQTSIIGDMGLIAISFALKNNTIVKELHLQNTAISSSGIVQLVKTLRYGTCAIEKLYLQDNPNIGNIGAESISTLFRPIVPVLSSNNTTTTTDSSHDNNDENKNLNHCSLKLLNLARCNIGDVGVAAIADALLSSVSAAQEQVQAVTAETDPIRANETSLLPSLRKLYLYDNNISNIGSSALAELIIQCSKEPEDDDESYSEYDNDDIGASIRSLNASIHNSNNTRVRRRRRGTVTQELNPTTLFLHELFLWGNPAISEQSLHVVHDAYMTHLKYSTNRIKLLLVVKFPKRKYESHYSRSNSSKSKLQFDDDDNDVDDDQSLLDNSFSADTMISYWEESNRSISEHNINMSSVKSFDDNSSYASFGDEDIDNNDKDISKIQITVDPDTQRIAKEDCTSSISYNNNQQQSVLIKRPRAYSNDGLDRHTYHDFTNSSTSTNGSYNTAKYFTISSKSNHQQQTGCDNTATTGTSSTTRIRNRGLSRSKSSDSGRDMILNRMAMENTMTPNNNLKSGYKCTASMTTGRIHDKLSTNLFKQQDTTLQNKTIVSSSEHKVCSSDSDCNTNSAPSARLNRRGLYRSISEWNNQETIVKRNNDYMNRNSTHSESSQQQKSHTNNPCIATDNSNSQINKLCNNITLKRHEDSIKIKSNPIITTTNTYRKMTDDKVVTIPNDTLDKDSIRSISSIRSIFEAGATNDEINTNKSLVKKPINACSNKNTTITLHQYTDDDENLISEPVSGNGKSTPIHHLNINSESLLLASRVLSPDVLTQQSILHHHHQQQQQQEEINNAVAKEQQTGIVLNATINRPANHLCSNEQMLYENRNKAGEILEIDSICETQNWKDTLQVPTPSTPSIDTMLPKQQIETPLLNNPASSIMQLIPSQYNTVSPILQPSDHSSYVESESVGFNHQDESSLITEGLSLPNNETDMSNAPICTIEHNGITTATVIDNGMQVGSLNDTVECESTISLYKAQYTVLDRIEINPVIHDHAITESSTSSGIQESNVHIKESVIENGSNCKSYNVSTENVKIEQDVVSKTVTTKVECRQSKILSNQNVDTRSVSRLDSACIECSILMDAKDKTDYVMDANSPRRLVDVDKSLASSSCLVNCKVPSKTTPSTEQSIVKENFPKEQYTELQIDGSHRDERQENSNPVAVLKSTSVLDSGFRDVKVSEMRDEQTMVLSTSNYVMKLGMASNFGFPDKNALANMETKKRMQVHSNDDPNLTSAINESWKDKKKHTPAYKEKISPDRKHERPSIYKLSQKPMILEPIAAEPNNVTKEKEYEHIALNAKDSQSNRKTNNFVIHLSGNTSTSQRAFTSNTTTYTTRTASSDDQSSHSIHSKASDVTEETNEKLVQYKAPRTRKLTTQRRIKPSHANAASSMSLDSHSCHTLQSKDHGRSTIKEKYSLESSVKTMIKAWENNSTIDRSDHSQQNRSSTTHIQSSATRKTMKANREKEHQADKRSQKTKVPKNTGFSNDLKRDQQKPRNSERESQNRQNPADLGIVSTGMKSIAATENPLGALDDNSNSSLESNCATHTISKRLDNHVRFNRLMNSKQAIDNREIARTRYHGDNKSNECAMSEIDSECILIEDLNNSTNFIFMEDDPHNLGAEQASTLKQRVEEVGKKAARINDEPKTLREQLICDILKAIANGPAVKPSTRRSPLLRRVSSCPDVCSGLDTTKSREDTTLGSNGDENHIDGLKREAPFEESASKHELLSPLKQSPRRQLDSNHPIHKQIIAKALKGGQNILAPIDPSSIARVGIRIQVKKSTFVKDRRKSSRDPDGKSPMPKTPSLRRVKKNSPVCQDQAPCLPFADSFPSPVAAALQGQTRKNLLAELKTAVIQCNSIEQSSSGTRTNKNSPPNDVNISSDCGNEEFELSKDPPGSRADTKL